MLRGYQENPKRPNVVKQALAVYDSIFASNSPVKPSIIHTNAILGVCARAGDMDSIWSITGRLPNRGPDSADHKTYSILLTAITADARDRVLKLGSKEQKRRPADRSLNTDAILEQAVEDGRRIWTEITARWRKADFEIDSKLVCAMGRLLMLSSQRKHHQEILALVEQTMNINATIEMLSPSQSGTAAEAIVGFEINTSALGEAQVLRDDITKNVAISGRSDAGGQESLKPMLKISDNSVFAKPDGNTLSMYLETATTLKDIEAGKKMWRVCTSPSSPYRLKPDGDNIASYLRLLRLARASREALELLQSLTPAMWRDIWRYPRAGGIFMISMSTCVRDKNNSNVFTTAGRILDLMQETAQQYGEASEVENQSSGGRIGGRLSPKVLSAYVQLAMATTRGLNGEKLAKDERTGDLNFERNPSKNNTLRALKRLSPETINIKQLIKLHMAEYERQHKDTSRTRRVQGILRAQASLPEPVQDLVNYITTLISAYDKLLMINEQLEDEGLGPLSREILVDINMEKKKLSYFVGMVNGVPGMGPSKFQKPTDSPSLDLESNGSSGPIESSAHKAIKKDIEEQAKTEGRKTLQRGLSSRQKHELQKELYLRENFWGGRFDTLAKKQGQLSSELLTLSSR